MRWQDSFPLDSSTCESRSLPSMNRGELNILGSNPAIPARVAPAPGSDEDFQKLLLRIAAKANESSDAGSLIKLFCHATREFFQVSGVYFWRRDSADELVGEQAEGKMAARFTGLRLRAQESAVTAEAVRQRRAIFA